MGPLLYQTYIYMCSFTFCFTWSTWLGKLVFSSLRAYLKRSSFFFFFKLKLCMNYWTFSLLFFVKHTLVLFTESWKHFSLIPFVPFFNFANHVYRQDITNDILWIKTYSLECDSPLKIQLYRNFAVLFVVILIIGTQSQEGNMYICKGSWRLLECDQVWV